MFKRWRSLHQNPATMLVDKQFALAKALGAIVMSSGGL